MKLNKKIILGTTTILTIVTPLATVVSCGDKTTLDKTTIYLNKINTAIDNKQNSIIFPTTEDKRPTIKGILTKLGIDQDSKFDVSFENTPTWIKDKKTSIKFKVCLKGEKGNSKISKELQVTWKVVIQSQFTKYKIGSGKAITASVHDLSKIKGENITITQIGFQTLKDKTVQVDQMPKGVIAVPKDLPSEITSTKQMFFKCSKFNEDISNWNVSNVTNMRSMFYKCESFNKPLNDWNVSNVKDMYAMFYNCLIFDQNLNNWNVSNVANMFSMFFNSLAFNQDLNNWNVSNITNMNNMFLNCKSFNKAVNNWDVSNVTTMNNMFRGCLKFNQDLNRWNTSNVTTMNSMFLNCKSFNKAVNNWDVSNVTTMNNMFRGCLKFNQDLNRWNTSNVTTMNSMFKDCSLFNGDISQWIVSNVTDTSWMFANCSSFNQNISNWDVSKVKDMSAMLNGAGIFYQNLSGWVLSDQLLYVTNFVSYNSPMFPKSTPITIKPAYWPNFKNGWWNK